MDILKKNGKTIITVESENKGKRLDGYGGDYPLFDCEEEDLVLINK